MAPRQRLPGWFADEHLPPGRPDPAPAPAHHRHRGHALRTRLRSRSRPHADHAPARHAGLGHPPDRGRPLGPPRLDARPLRRRGPARRRGVRNDGGAVMRFSYCMLPDYPLDDAIDMIKMADELGFYAAYSVDETWHKDLWVLFAAAARETTNIRFGPNVTHVFLREPTLICQQMATLDELTKGRTEIVVSTGNFGLLAQYGIDWAGRKPLSRLKEAIHVMRTFLDEGAITFDGDFFQYSGLYTFARPVQDRIPIKMGAMKGPRSFQAAGELADGMH